MTSRYFECSIASRLDLPSQEVMKNNVCTHCGSPDGIELILCEKCAATLRPPVSLAQFPSQPIPCSPPPPGLFLERRDEECEQARRPNFGALAVLLVLSIFVLSLSHVLPAFLIVGAFLAFSATVLYGLWTIRRWNSERPEVSSPDDGKNRLT